MIRRRGYALNDQVTEVGLTAIGKAIAVGTASTPVAAIAVAMPTTRFRRSALQAWNAALSSTVAAIERDLNTAPAGDS